MLKYAVILLDKTSVAYCHADNPYTEKELIDVKTLKDAIFWAMTENLVIQFVYPDYKLPKEHLDAIDTIDHIDISRSSDSDIIIADGLKTDQDIKDKNIVIRLSLTELLANEDSLIKLIQQASHVSVIIKDIHKLSEADLDKYKNFLDKVIDDVEVIYKDGGTPQLNILTDRLVLDSMNNCNAGHQSITIGPNGNFYVCPAFYYDNEDDNLGSLSDGLTIKNSRLYDIDYAPICRCCDAYHCHRCVWLNRKTTLEVNTPGHEQCVVSHIERNASRKLLYSVRKYGDFLPEKEIKEIDYIDPFYKIINK